MASVIHTLLFDLGGVLVDWDGTRPLVEGSNHTLTVEQARRFWLESPSVRAFETGRITAERFAEGAVGELGLPMEPEQFLRAFASWDKGPMPGAISLLKTLRRKYTLACLSNNNVIHWNRPRLRKLLAFFQYCFVSFKTGVLKPDHDAFQYALDRMAISPGTIIFFDDNPECIESARQMGFRAIEVKGVEDVKKALRGLG
jgi:putative hydrolase of the HAD superfamily